MRQAKVSKERDIAVSKKKLGLALVGLGHYATDRIAPALQNSQFWKLTGIVSGSPDKAAQWQKEWNLAQDNILNYENFDRIVDCPDIDAVYICLPNSMHADFTIRAAKAGKHVIVEKPMATNIADAERMIEACRAAGVHLAVGYRLRFNRFHRQIAEWGRNKTYGKVDYINAIFSINVGEPSQWRLNQTLSGGGALMDVGIYCIQAARYVTGEEPVSVKAQFGPVVDTEKYAEVEGSISWQMKFPRGTYVTAYAGFEHYIDELCIRAEKAFYKLESAFSYGPLSGILRTDEDHIQPIDLPNEHHQLMQMEELGQLISSGHPPPDYASGQEGLSDMKIIEAIYKAAETGEEIYL